MPDKNAGVGSYWQGISNDAYYDQGKLWIIGRIGGRGRNGGGLIEFKEVAINGGDWKYGKAIEVSSNGTSCDIHLYYPEVSTFFGISRGFVAPPKLKATIRGERLIIESQDITIKSAGLYNLLGINVAQPKLTGATRNSIPLNTISNGKYILEFYANKASYQKPIFILRQ